MADKDLISRQVRQVLDKFEEVLKTVQTEKYDDKVTLVQWQSEYDRLRLWVANLGAHQTGSSSLDYRLRDASHVKEQCIALLESLRTDLEDLCSLVQEDIVEGAFDSDAEEEGETEVGQIYRIVATTIRNLLRLSMIIRRSPAQYDRIKKPQDVSAFVNYDIWHVRDKFPSINPKLAERFGQANARRRAMRKYRERHQMKLKHGLDGQSIAPSSTQASDMTGIAQAATGDADNESISGSNTSFAPSLFDGSKGIRVPRPPAPLGEAPFECDHCLLIVDIDTTHKWAGHIFKDLQAYQCFMLDCNSPHRLYDNRNEWFLHCMTEHSHSINEAMKMCPICGVTGFESSVIVKRHLGRHMQELALFTVPADSSEEVDGMEVSDENTDEPAVHTIAENASEDPNERMARIKNYGAEVIAPSGNSPPDNSPLPSPILAGEDDDKINNKISGSSRIIEGLGLTGQNPYQPRDQHAFADPIDGFEGILQEENTGNVGDSGGQSQVTVQQANSEDDAYEYTGPSEQFNRDYPRARAESARHEGRSEEPSQVPQVSQSKENSDFIGNTPVSDRIPTNARWTKINRTVVNPEALEEAGERFEEREDYVIVLRVLAKSEIQKLADRTAEIRSQREHNLNKGRSGRSGELASTGRQVFGLHSGKAQNKVHYKAWACVRCRQRKTRCDRTLPRCMPCERSNSVCEIYDIENDVFVPRIHYFGRHSETEYGNIADPLEGDKKDRLKHETGKAVPAYLSQFGNLQETAKHDPSTQESLRQSHASGEAEGPSDRHHYSSDADNADSDPLTSVPSRRRINSLTSSDHISQRETIASSESCVQDIPTSPSPISHEVTRGIVEGVLSQLRSAPDATHRNPWFQSKDDTSCGPCLEINVVCDRLRPLCTNCEQRGKACGPLLKQSALTEAVMERVLTELKTLKASDSPSNERQSDTTELQQTVEKTELASQEHIRSEEEKKLTPQEELGNEQGRKGSKQDETADGITQVTANKPTATSSNPERSLDIDWEEWDKLFPPEKNRAATGDDLSQKNDGRDTNESIKQLQRSGSSYSTKQSVPEGRSTTAPDAQPHASSTSRKRLSSKPRIGCWTCRFRNSRCDEVQPVCGQCSRGGYVCDYSPRLAFRDDTERIGELVEDPNVVGEPGSGRRETPTDRDATTQDTKPLSMGNQDPNWPGINPGDG